MKELSLGDFLSQYPHISLATREDNQEILDFYHQTSLSSSDSEIIYTRGNDFFAFLEERSSSSLILLLRNDQALITGMGVLTYRPGYIDGVLQTIGYLGDLRIRMNRKLIREWRLMYANLMKLSPQMRETHYCRYYQTALIDGNKESTNNLAETKIANLNYHKLQKYKMVNIIGRIKLRTPSTYIRSATNEDKKLVMNFLSLHGARDLFAHDWTQELDHRLKCWNGFSMANLLLSFNKQGNLTTLAFAWNPIQTKQIRLTKIPDALKILHSLGKRLPLLEFKTLPEENTPLDILYLSQAIFDKGLDKKSKQKILHDFIHHAFEKDFHMLAYADFEHEDYLEKTLSFFMQKMPMAIFSVHYIDDQKTIHHPLHWNHSKPTVSFDMCLV